MNQYPDIQLYQQEMLKMPVSQQLIMDVSWELGTGTKVMPPSFQLKLITQCIAL